MRIECTGAFCVATEIDIIATGAVNYFPVKFTFDSAWATILATGSVYASFHGSNVVILSAAMSPTVEGQETIYTAILPWEVLVSAGELKIGAIGVIDEGLPSEVILTTTLAFICRVPSGATSGMDTSQSSGILQDILVAAADALESANDAEAAASHYPYIDEITHTWWNWDIGTGAFIDTEEAATGAAAGFGIPTASVTGIAEGLPPTVVITATGGDTAKIFDFDFEIPKGDKGDAAEIIINSTITGAPGTNASVTNIGDEHTAILNFTIPQGTKGNTGTAAGFGTPTTSTVTGAPSTDASVAVTATGVNTAKVFGFNFTIPRGDTGDAATIAVGTVSTVLPSVPATVTNSGTSGAAIFDFEIPQGFAATLEVGTVTTVTPQTPATVTNSGTSGAAVFDFEIPQGEAATVVIGTTTTGAPGTDANVTNSGTNIDAVFDFTIPEGEKGDAATITVGTTTTGTPGSSAVVTNSGTSAAAVFDFSIPEGLKGDTGADFQLLGLYATLLALETAHPTGSAGDAYAVGTESSNTIYIWDTGISDWVDVGELQGPRGSIWYNGTGITGTSVLDTVFTGSGITDAQIRDLYLNSDTSNVYQCTLSGNAATATWIYICNIHGHNASISGAGAPTSATVGSLGMIYFDSTDDDTYICTDITGEIYTWTLIALREEVTQVQIVRW